MMKSRYLIIIGVFTSSASSTLVEAQTSESVQRAAQIRDDPTFGDGSLSALSGVSVEAGENSGQARLKVSKNTGRGSFGLTVTTPFRKDQPSTAFATLDGLSNSLNLSVTATRFLLSGESRDTEELAGSVICQEFGINPDFIPTDEKANWPGGTICSGAALAAKREALTQIEELFDAASDGSGQLTPEQVGMCQRFGLAADECSQFALARKREASTDAVDRFLDATFSEGVWLATGEGKIGRKTFEYFPEADEEKQTEKKVPYSASFGVGRLGQSTLWSAKVAYQRSYKDAEEATRCQAIEESDSLERCKELPLGEPIKKDGALVTLGFRKFFEHLAISPTVAYDVEGDTWGIDVPMYFVQNANSQFTGGVRVGWNSDRDDVILAVFVSQALSLGF